MTLDRRGVVRFRVRRHQLDREPGTAAGPTDVALLDLGVQDTGPDGAAWALASRGAPPAGPDDLAFAWTVRGAPHAYRRQDLAAVAVATSPLSEVDAAKRIFDASKPLKEAGIPVLDALRVVADHLRRIVVNPTVKGDVSGRLTDVVDQRYLRSCGPCAAIHVYEMPFRLSALQAGLELEPGTSPPVMRRVPGLRPTRFGHLGGEADPRLDVIRNYLRLYGPAQVRHVAEFLDSPLREVRAHWPDDAVEVTVDGLLPGRKAEPRFILAADLDALHAAWEGSDPAPVRLLGPYDPYLQARDRHLLVPEEAHRKELWPVLGRPGAVVDDGEIVATWRPHTSGRRLTVRLDPWEPMTPMRRAAVEAQAELLADHRGVPLAGVSD